MITYILPAIARHVHKNKYKYLQLFILALFWTPSKAQTQTPINLGISDSNHYVRIANSTAAFPLPPFGTLLHLINNNVQNARVSLSSYYSGGVQGPVYTGLRARGTVSSPTAVNADDILACVNFTLVNTFGYSYFVAHNYISSDQYDKWYFISESIVLSAALLGAR